MDAPTDDNAVDAPGDSPPPSAQEWETSWVNWENDMKTYNIDIHAPLLPPPLLPPPLDGPHPKRAQDS